MSKFLDDIQIAIKFLPEHRQEHRRTQNLHLDDLFDDYRSFASLSGNALDLILTSYRYHHAFESYLESFLKKKALRPNLLKDLLLLSYSCFLTRGDHAPLEALANDFVEYAKKTWGPSITGLSNAFVRGLSRNLAQEKARLQNDGIRFFLSNKQIENIFQLETIEETLTQKIQERPPSGVLGFDLESLKLERVEEPDFQKFQAMDGASYYLVEWMASQITQPPKRILDACAAPGGKLLLLLKLLQRKFGPSWQAEILATDVSKKRLQRLEENILKAAFKFPVKCAVIDWTQQKTSEESFDLILADLPCSGSGTCATRPDVLIKDFLDSKTLQPLMNTQEKILAALTLHLNSKGLLFGSLCSFLKPEVNTLNKILGKGGKLPHFTSWPTRQENVREFLCAWKYEIL